MDILVPLLGAVLTAVILYGIYAFSPRRRSSRGDDVARIAPTPRRQLPVLIECATCQHFDLEEGQAALQQYPAFLGAAAVRSPAQMSQRALLDAHGNVTGWKEDGEDGAGKTTPLKAKWADFGACAVHQEGRYKHDVCNQYARAAALADEHPGFTGNSIEAG